MLLSRPQRALVVAAVLLGTGPASRALSDFSLAPAVSIPLPAGSAPHDLRALDVTGDGLVDLVVVSALQPDVQVLVGQGGGAFSAPVVTTFAPVDVFDLGDVNGDGRPDLVESQHSGPATLQAHFGDGLGGFPTAGVALDVSAGGIVAGIILLDADEDGDLDALVEQGGGLNACFGDGAGSFVGPGLFTSSPSLYIFQEPHVLDVNGDGHLDVVSSGNAFFDAGWALFLGDGSGAFSFSQFEYTSPDGDVYGSALGDFDGEHRTDFVMDDQNFSCRCHQLAFAQGTGSGLVAPEPQSQVIAPPYHSRIRAGDLDRDGLDDVVGLSNKPWILLGHGDFTFAAPQFFELANPATFARDVALSDVDGDGALDVLVLSEPPQISIFINQSPPSGWMDMGHGLAGSDGVPSLLGQGELQFSSPGSLKLTHANPGKLAVLFVGPSANPAPFKGGMLVPVPVTMLFMLGTSPTGSITLSWNSWPHLPPGTDYFFQFAIVDSAGPAGASLSNAVRALQP